MAYHPDEPEGGKEVTRNHAAAARYSSHRPIRYTNSRIEPGRNRKAFEIRVSMPAISTPSPIAVIHQDFADASRNH